MKTSTSIPSYRDNSLPLFARIKIAWHILFKRNPCPSTLSDIFTDALKQFERDRKINDKRKSDREIEAKNSEDKRKAEERSKILKAQRETKVGGMPHKVWY